MSEVIFLLVLAFAWVLFAVIQDLRKREIADWLNFSLVIFALGIRFFYSLFSNDFSSFLQGIIGFGVFFAIGNILYYGRMFAGGDAKLMMALGAVIPIYPSFFDNFKIFILFILAFTFSGAIYGLLMTVILSLKNRKKFKKEFLRQIKGRKKLFYLLFPIGVLIIIFSFFLANLIFAVLGILFFIMPVLYIYSKAVEEACMIKEIKTNLLAEGDWLYENVKIGRKTIKPNWEGLTKEQIKEIRKRYRNIRIKEGIPFSPVFLISLLAVIFSLLAGLWNSFW